MPRLRKAVEGLRKRCTTGVKAAPNLASFDAFCYAKNFVQAVLNSMASRPSLFPMILLSSKGLMDHAPILRPQSVSGQDGLSLIAFTDFLQRFPSEEHLVPPPDFGRSARAILPSSS